MAQKKRAKRKDANVAKPPPQRDRAESAQPAPANAARRAARETPAQAREAPEKPFPFARVAPFVVAVLTALVYGNAAPNALVVDDVLFAPDPNNPVTFASILRLFREDAWAAVHLDTGVYRPLALTTIALDSLLFDSGASGAHVTNIVMHVLATVVVYAVIHLLLKADAARRGDAAAAAEAWKPAAIAGLVFGVHPIHTEAVDSIFNRSEVLATLGVAGAIWLVLRYGEERPRLAWGGAAAAYFAAILCRESALTLPALLALLLLLFRSEGTAKERLRALAPALVLLVPLAIYAVLRYRVFHGATVIASQPTGQGHAAGATLGERVELVVSSTRDFLRMMIWPAPLRASYDDYAASFVWPTAIFHVALIGACVALHRRAPWLAAGVGFFYIALLPSSRLVTHTGVVVTIAERYAYLPSVGAAIVLAFGVAALAKKHGQAVFPAVGAPLFVVLSIVTRERNEQWHSQKRLWEAEVEAAPDNGDGWKWLTGVYINEGLWTKIPAICAKQGPRFPERAGLHIHCGVAYEQTGDEARAREAYEAAVKADPSNVTHVSLARFSARTKRTQEAEQQYLLAINAERDPARKHTTRGEMLYRLHPEKLDEAEAEYEAALAIDPRFSTAKDGLAKVQRARSRGGAPRP